MGQYTIKLPDVGEGIAQAELVEWMVEEGQSVREDEVLAAVMTDKATVEIPSPVEGRIIWRGGVPGDNIAVGAPIIRLDVEEDVDSDDEVDTGDSQPAPESFEDINTPAPIPEPAVSGAPDPRLQQISNATMIAKARPSGQKPLASPAVRQRAREGGIDLYLVQGSGPEGRINHSDLDAIFAGENPVHVSPATQSFQNGQLASAATGSINPPMDQPFDMGDEDPNQITQLPVIGLRRKIAEQMTRSASNIAHITYVEEIDLTDIEILRERLNRNRNESQPKLTILPFVLKALTRALEEHPKMNARYDSEAGILHQYHPVHVGIAAQTPGGLMVPVVRDVATLSIWQCAAQIDDLATAAREGTIKRDQLTGSTITVTSLGALGGVVTTPIINYPEVAILGPNKIQTKPVWDGTSFIPRKIMNFSSSFDHRVIDGYECAVFIQRIKSLLESPAEIFIQE